ncbi:MAG: putative amidohydrolase [Psychromonas sp.]|jgi:predicted amidohydrolase
MSQLTEKIQVAALQISSQPGQVEKNLLLIEQAITQACTNNNQLDLIVLPELVISGFILGNDAARFAMDVEGAQFRFLANLAKQYQVHIVYGYIEKDVSGSLYNSQAIVSDQGILIANYRKIHLTEFELETFSPGNQLVIADTKFGKIGMMICWDIAFPEMARLYTLNGCILLSVSSAWEKPHDHALKLFSMARAIDNTLYVIVSNTSGRSSGFEFVGESAIYDPTGRIIKTLDDQSGVVMATINFQEQINHRDDFYSMLKERRKDIYQLSCQSIS